jgi:Yip1 domain
MREHLQTAYERSDSDAYGEADMDIIERVNRILTTPTTEWKIISEERGDLQFLLNNYIAILAGIPAVCGLIGFAAIGVVAPSGATLRVPLFSGLLGAVFGYLMAFVAVYVIALAVNFFAPKFGAQRDFPSALKLVVYSYTPVWITGVFLLVPGLWFLTVLGIYGFYPLWRGLPQLMKAPQEQSLLYAGTITLCALVIRVLIGWIEATLFSLPQVI